MSVTLANIVYASSIDSISDLAARVAYDTTVTNPPVVILMHGYSGSMTDFGDTTLTRYANYGLFVVAVGMRGRNSASGSPDSGGRELYDIYDALTYVRSNYSVSTDRAAIVGYSGGGGNAVGMACRFPDTFQVVTEFFGMTDYGHTDTGWYYTAPSPYPGMMDTWIGGSPTSYPDRYHARYTRGSIGNYSYGGHLYVYHDSQDVSVSVVNATALQTAMTAIGMTNSTVSISGPGDSTRWYHGYPDTGTPLVSAESTFVPAIVNNTYPVWQYPTSGSVVVCGWLITKQFSIWLGDGTSEAAECVFDVTAGTFIVTPLTGSVAVSIVSGTSSVTGTVSVQSIFSLDGTVTPVDSDLLDTIPYLYTGSGMMVGGYGETHTTATQSNLKYFDGFTWNQKPLKVYSVSAWIEKSLKHFDGTTWV